MGTRLTPMNILRDNIKLQIECQWCGTIKKDELSKILDMIEGDSLGKSLIDQEEDMFIDAFVDGFRLQEHHGDLIDEDKAKEIAKEVFDRHYNKEEDES